jgi:dimethylargininase
MLAITHVPSPKIQQCELTYVSRTVIEYPRALLQHDSYCRMLRDCGAEVRVLDVNRDYPDCVFIEDTAVVLDEVAVLASMGAESRRAEPAGIEPELRKYREVQRVELPGTLEGGDVVRVGRTLLVGLSSRTNPAGLAALARVAAPHDYRVVGVPLRDCLHLKSACTSLPDRRLLINPAWVDARSLPGFECVHVPGEEPAAADVMSIGMRVCVTAAHPRTAEMLDRFGFEVHMTDLSEFAKAEGGVTCLSLILGSH